MNLEILYRYEHYGRFLRRPYYDNKTNYKDLKDKYRDYELFAHCWAKIMEGVFTYPYPHNKGRVIYEMEMKQEIRRLLDSMDDATPKQYILREFFMTEFLAIGSYEQVKDLVLSIERDVKLLISDGDKARTCKSRFFSVLNLIYSMEYTFYGDIKQALHRRKNRPELTTSKALQ
ncbi:hypothetical protein BPOR_0383g00050 [Botrytis porri]|uniref:Uncharacterized protein n=1 Tax=Botrytis porri TaxID=87229 RepID=A0A4Z1KSD0_9HELO|nr:hypothetical protein BPOR_0383g00050 [Botrytis porri]